MIRLLIVDDEALVREGLRMILDAQPDMEVVGEAADGRAALELAARLDPDVVLMDIRMPRLDGLEATRRLLSEPTRAARVLILTTFDLDEYVYFALRAGASGFLLKSTRPHDLIAAVRATAAGDTLLAPEVTRRLIEAFVTQPPPAAGSPALETLTPREREVLGHIARGQSNAEIAGLLYLSDETIKTHASRIFSKLGARDRTQAVILAYEHGLVRPGSRAWPSPCPARG
jgi:DNA-binding NarL/FixJ family response regulator